MLHEHSLEKYFWAKAVSTTCYVVNRASIRSILNKTPYELWKGCTPSYHILEFLVQNVLFLMKRPEPQNLIPNRLKGFFWDTQGQGL